LVQNVVWVHQDGPKEANIGTTLRVVSVYVSSLICYIAGF